MDIGHFCLSCKVPVIGDMCERCERPMDNPKIPLKASPVFKEELKMLADVTGEPVDEFNSLELWAANRHYYYEGKKIWLSGISRDSQLSLNQYIANCILNGRPSIALTR